MNTIDTLLNSYIEYAILHGKGIVDGDSELTNKNYCLLKSTYKKIKKIEGFEKHFDVLLSNSDDSVLMCAATESLMFNERKALKILKKIKKKNKGILGFVVSTIIGEWKNGNLK